MHHNNFHRPCLQTSKENSQAMSITSLQHLLSPCCCKITRDWPFDFELMSDRCRNIHTEWNYYYHFVKHEQIARILKSESAFISNISRDWFPGYIDGMVNRVITAVKAPRGTMVFSGLTHDRWHTVGKVVTIVKQEAIVSELTAVVSGASFQALDAHIAISCRWCLQTTIASMSLHARSSYFDFWVFFATKERKNCIIFKYAALKRVFF